MQPTGYYSAAPGQNTASAALGPAPIAHASSRAPPDRTVPHRAQPPHRIRTAPPHHDSPPHRPLTAAPLHRTPPP
ncbi:MAG: hypothetical protein IPP47_31330 [Bryobacterales bacterium]|nr:hypothetical protein [Bryobacterales bacterium]